MAETPPSGDGTVAACWCGWNSFHAYPTKKKAEEALKAHADRTGH